MSDPTARLRQRVIYRGRVQGIGFRYTTASIAKRYPVVGYVKNLPDGSVELVADAGGHVLEQFLGDILREFADYVRQYDVQIVPSDETLEAFEIRR